MIIRDAWVEIDTEALIHNYMQVRRAVGPGVKICPVLKAQCYGMGGRQVARILDELGADMFAVAVPEEALELREITRDKEILVLGYVSRPLHEIAVQNGISLTMYSYPSLLELAQDARKLGKRASVHIKINSGMNRLGFPVSEASADQIFAASRLENIEIRGIFTHFATADEQDKSETHAQAARFYRLLALLRERGMTLPTVHMANSPAICDLPEYDADMVRPGLLLTGHYTSEQVRRDRVELRPCVRLKARLGNKALIRAGEGIGYGFTRRLERDTLIGVLPVGFSGGFTRAFSNNFHVLAEGKACPVIGSICMDQCIIDLTNAPDAKVGDEVILYGNGRDGAISVEEVAEKRGTIVDEVLTNLAARLPRVFI